MNKYWISWYHDTHKGGFELNSPWWITSYIGDTKHIQTICAAVKANNEEHAKQIIQYCYDTPQIFDISNWRFFEEQPYDWSPFNSRFPQEHWMKW